MTVLVRNAELIDRAMFLCRWAEYLTEMHKKGSEILPTERTITFYGELFDAYVTGAREGVAAILYPVGVALAGDCTPSYDSTYGKTAIGWGTYVHPDARGGGHSSALRSFVIDRLRAQGFETLLGSVGVDDGAALASIAKVSDARVVQHVYMRRLQS